jgi:hypothetical protein
MTPSGRCNGNDDNIDRAETGDNIRSNQREVNLSDYWSVLCKHKLFIVLATLLPTLIAGMALFIYPRDYKITYVYDVSDDASISNLDEKKFDVLCSRFYSENNLNKIFQELQKNKLNKPTEQLEKSFTDKGQNFVKLEVSPPFLDISKLKLNDHDQINNLRSINASLISMTITTKPKETLLKTAVIVKHNFEKVISLYLIRNELWSGIREYKSNGAEIEGRKFKLHLAVTKDCEKLSELRKIKTEAGLNQKDSSISLQFNVGNKSEYLPLPYQVQALESKIVENRTQLKYDEANYNYYSSILELNATILSELNDKLASDNSLYTTDMFNSYLTNLGSKYEKIELKDYLASYTKRIENLISATVPVSENPGVIAIAKGTTKKTMIVLAVSLLLSTFVTFLRQGSM